MSEDKQDENMSATDFRWGNLCLFYLFVISMVPGAGLEPARPQWPGDFKCLATTPRYISVHLATATTSITKAILM